MLVTSIFSFSHIVFKSPLSWIIKTGIFSLSFFQKPEVFLEHWSHCCRHRCCCRSAKTVTFCNVSIITEDIYLKFGVCIHYQSILSILRAIHTIKGDNSKCIFFIFSELYPFFNLNCLSSIKHPTAERWHPDVVLLFNPFPNKPLLFRVCITSLLKTLGKGEIARNKQFLLFPQCFLPF